MTTYARVQDGIVQELFDMPPQWSAIPIASLFARDIGDWVDVTATQPQPRYGWSYDGASFSPPPPLPDHPDNV